MNQAVQLKYKSKGKSRDHELMKAKAFQEMEEILTMDDSDSERVQKEPTGMHPLSLSVFVKKLQNFKKLIQRKYTQLDKDLD